MKKHRLLAVCTTAAACWVLAAPAAHGHGGAYQPPPAPPPTPPWLRGDPFAPSLTAPRLPVPPRVTPRGTPRVGLPTTPIGPMPSPIGPGGKTGSPLAPGGSVAPPSAPARGPLTPGSKPPLGRPVEPRGEPETTGSRPTAPARPGGRARPSSAAGDWTAWWDQNADALRERSALVHRTLTGTGSDDAALLLRRAREATVVPLLREVLAGAHGMDEDLLASAALAMGKNAEDPDDVAHLVAILKEPGAPRLAREGAALGLGLLRRSDPKAQFDGVLLERVRGALFDAMDDDSVPVRARCFAALALGLLGDQPGREDDPLARAGRLVTRGLWARLLEPRTGQETSVAILVALSLQPPEGFPSHVREGLRGLAATGRLEGRERGSVAQAHAVLALSRLRGDEVASVLFAVVRGSRNDAHLRRSAAVGLGTLAPAMDATRRAQAAALLVDRARRGDPDTAGLAWISTARILAAEAAEGSCAAARRTGADEALLDAAEHGAAGTRPYAALGLGLLLRAPAPPGDAPGDGRLPLRERALALMRTVVDREGEDPGVRGAFALSLGLARDAASSPLLARLAATSDAAPALRAYACAALGLVGRSTPETLEALRAALADRREPEVRREAARALGTLGDARAVASLVAELTGDSADHVRGRAALALGEIADPGSARALAALARDPSAGDLARALAIAALGLVTDPEPVRSLSRLGADSNFWAPTEALNEALSLL